ERMSWRRGQLRMSNPNVFLLFPLLARPHRHTRILRSLPVDPSNSFAYASGLTPRAARVVLSVRSHPTPPSRTSRDRGTLPTSTHERAGVLRGACRFFSRRLPTQGC